ncbi:MAG: hypothetical protein ACRDQ7_15620 [Haloechinothrix sp.]
MSLGRREPHRLAECEARLTALNARVDQALALVDDALRDKSRATRVGDLALDVRFALTGARDPA